jgi:putative zinc finger/helix-turn-helix YgiT family protein
MRTTMLFEYTCPECSIGTVKTTLVHNYKTKIKGYPFIVDEALIGVCDHCKAEHFAPEETKRWEELFSRSLEERQAFLSPQEITGLRKTLGLSMEDFARLMGCTRQSIYNWEKTDRTAPPSRMADLVMRMVNQSLRSGTIDVITFLLEEARKWGVVVEIRREAAPSGQSMVLRTKHIKQNALPQPVRKLTLAAESALEEDELIAVETLEGEAVGLLRYDYELAALVLDINGNFPPWKVVDVEIETDSGECFANHELSVHNRHLILLKKTPIREDKVVQITLRPSQRGGTRIIDG